MEQVTAVLASLGVVQALFLSLYLVLLKKGNKAANVFLALVLIGLSIRIGKSIFNYFIVLEPWQRNIGLSGLLIVGPSVWFYGKALIDRNWKPSINELLHYLPFALFIIFSRLIPNQFTAAAYVMYCLVSAHWLIYLIASERNRRTVLETVCNDDINRWYRNIVVGLACIWLYYMAVFLRLIPYYIGGAIMYSVLIYAFSYMMLQKHNFALEKYSRSKSSKQDTQRIVERVIKVFAEQQSYLNPKLSLSSLSALLDISPRELSRAINEHRQQNFSEFVNSFRITRATEILAQPEHQNTKLAAIAFDCGFANVTTFSLAFKSIVQSTPSQYRANNASSSGD